MWLAHGVGSRGDLPVPVGPAAAAAAATLVISFVVLALLWRRPRAASPGRPLPDALAALLDRPLLRTALRGVSLLVLLAVVVIGFAGPTATVDNVVPWLFYITFWAGLVPLSLLFGPVVRVLNPLRLLHSGLAALLRVDPVAGLRRAPVWLGYWPAAVSLLAFAWFELVAPARAEPGAVAAFVTVYAVVHTGAAVVFGRSWFARGDGFEVYSTLLGGLSPVGRLPDGRLGRRNPLDGLESVAPGPGLVAVVVVLVGSTGFDGLSRATWWVASVPDDVPSGTLGLLGAILAVGLVYLLGSIAITPTGARPGSRPGPGAFATTLTPIAAGYAIAHYFSLLLFDGQQALILASDPMGTGADLFGTASAGVGYRWVGPVVIMVVQLGAIVVGHLIASVAAHDRAVRLYSREAAVRTQYPMLAAMVALTVGAVGLLFAS